MSLMLIEELSFIPFSYLNSVTFMNAVHWLFIGKLRGEFFFLKIENESFCCYFFSPQFLHIVLKKIPFLQRQERT